MILLSFYIRFETEAEKQKRLKEEALAKEMANVAIAFKLSEPSPMYDTVIPRETADIKVFTPIVRYEDTKITEITPKFEPPGLSTRINTSLRPQTSRVIKKTIEVVQARPTTSLGRREEKSFLPSVPTSTVKQDTKSKFKPPTPSKQITGNKITFETHKEETEAERNAKPKSKRLVKMQLSSGTSNYRYANGLERSPDLKVISSTNMKL